MKSSITRHFPVTEPLRPLTIFCLLALMCAAFSGCSAISASYVNYEKIATFSGIPAAKGAVIGEPFGLAFDKNGVLFISDGGGVEGGKIWQADKSGALKLVTDKLDTPSGIAFDKDGDLLVADSGTHTIKKINIASGEVTLVAGTENTAGFADGEATGAMFNAPIGIAADEAGKIYVADTYNDRIRVIENGRVSTVAGSTQGFTDAEAGGSAKFDTPCGIAVTAEGDLLIADTGNRRIRLLEKSGKVSTIAGGGTNEATVALPLETSFAEPIDVKADRYGVIYIADAGTNTIYAMGRRAMPVIEKLNSGKRGLTDDGIGAARMNRPTGVAADQAGNLFIADAENQLVRVLQNKDGSIGSPISKENIGNLRLTAEEFRAAAPARWPYYPAERPREIAGTLGEIRGESGDEKQAWFHNGLDVVGGYGETARFVRPEKVLRPMAAQLFATGRENLRMPTLGYIHLRLGRDQTDKPFADARFQWSRDAAGKLSGVRIRRGTKFQAGDPIGTLNFMNHIHLIAGRSGNEMNAIAALDLPGIKDSIPPVIESITLYDDNGRQIAGGAETQNPNSRINVAGKVRIAARSYDRMDGNAERRRLGIYRAGYQLLNEDGSVQPEAEEPLTTIRFDKLPDDLFDAPRLVYAAGSKSGATGETIFSYNVTNFVQRGKAVERYFDCAALAPGNYILRMFAADFAGNVTNKDIKITVGG